MDTLPEVVQYWNSRAGIGEMAGTRDLIAKQLEMKTLAGCFPIDSTESVIDMGCGNGMTSLYLKTIRPGLRILGVDNADGMIAHAIGRMNMERDRIIRGNPLLRDEPCVYTERTLENPACGDVSYEIGSVMDYRPKELVDCAYTERTLVNLPDWEAQRNAIMNILQMLRPGGTYLMMENSRDGVEELNTIRAMVGLSPIVPPWHNRYLQDAEIDSISVNEFGKLVQIINYSGAYYFLSRVVNAWLAKAAGTEPVYDAPCNKLALELPQIPGGLRGQGVLWVWRRSA